MNFFQDKKIRKIIKSENVKAPDSFSKIIDATLDNLEYPNKKLNKIPIFRISLKLATAMIILSLLVLPNISNEISYAMQEIPIVGDLIKIITIKSYFDKDGNSELEVEVPRIENIDESNDEASKIINEDIDRFTQRIIDSYNKEKDSENHLSVTVESDVLKNTNDWITLRLKVSEVRAGSNIQYKFYHIDKKKDKIIQLSNLFINEDFKLYISNEIKKQMISKMREDESIVYWVNSDVEEWNFDTIENNQEFYFSEKGNIVIVFDKYEVAPGAMGTPKFEINKDIYEKFLKEEYK